jgi:hypothetical protein
MDDEDYRLLARIERGASVFRPAESAPEAKQLFQVTVARLLELRQREWIHFSHGRVSQSQDGTYMAVGPCDLTPKGADALERDRRLGPRPST